MDVQLSPAKQFLLRMHLILCRKCSVVAQQMKAFRKVFIGLEAASLQDEIRSPESFQNRIQQVLHEQRYLRKLFLLFQEALKEARD